MSNGTLITREIAHRIHEAGVHEVQVSLDGLETVHDSIRGKDSFKRAWQGINNLVSQGIDTSVNLTISKLNMEQINGLVELGEKLGISAVTVSRLVSCGGGQEFCRQMLTPQELVELHKSLRQFNNRKVIVTSRDPLAAVADMDAETLETEFPVGGCAAGIFGVTITADSTVMPCRRMNLSIGNIKDKSFRKIWAESPVLWSLRNRENYRDGCKYCRYWSICRGCRAVALAYSRLHGDEDFLGPDPQCPYYRPSDSVCSPTPPRKAYARSNT